MVEVLKDIRYTYIEKYQKTNNDKAIDISLIARNLRRLIEKEEG